MYDSILNVEHLSASRGGFVLFDDISFGLKPGRALRITGPNGTGKTTLLRCVAGMVRPDSGSITAQNENAFHYLGHLNAMKLQLSVAENLAFWAKFYGSSDINSAIESRIDSAIDKMNLKRLKDLPFSVLSSGQKRRVAIARLLLSPRPIWLLDEPTVGLDIASQSLVEILLDAHLREGGIVLAATHMPLGTAHWQSLELNPVKTP